MERLTAYEGRPFLGTLQQDVGARVNFSKGVGAEKVHDCARDAQSGWTALLLQAVARRHRRNARWTTRGLLRRDVKSVCVKRHRDRGREQRRYERVRSTAPGLRTATEAGFRRLRGCLNRPGDFRSEQRMLRGWASWWFGLPSQYRGSTSCRPFSHARPGRSGLGCGEPTRPRPGPLKRFVGWESSGGST